MRSHSTRFPDCPRLQLPASNNNSRSLTATEVKWNQSQSYAMTDGLSASLSSYQAPIWCPRSYLCYLQKAAGFLCGHPLWREEGTVVYSCCWPSPSHSLVRVAQESWPYSTVSVSRRLQAGGQDLALNIYIYIYIYKKNNKPNSKETKPLK
jgi:hypothetical protein